ncbi:DUF4232 domain-containing protein [Streptomyces sp. NPDC006195]|uniref:DUF4232 domain-containing protein n=1 Tax=unclassified Streptomyces TaxID=2593676 RepID=UPI0033B1C279
MRNIRHRAAAAAATALVASLALTACGSGDNSSGAVKDSAAASLSTPSAKQQAQGDDKQQTPANQLSTTGGDNGTSDGTNTTAGGKIEADASSVGSRSKSQSSSGTTAKRTTCTGANTKVKVSQVTRPINHLLLTVTNTGSKNCDAYYAPALRFDEAQAATQIIEESKPQAVVTLAPGESAYASISLNGDGNPNIPAKELTVHFIGRANQGSVGSPAGPLKLPTGTRIADDTSVTYWQYEMADALTW